MHCISVLELLSIPCVQARQIDKPKDLLCPSAENQMVLTHTTKRPPAKAETICLLHIRTGDCALKPRAVQRSIDNWSLPHKVMMAEAKDTTYGPSILMPSVREAHRSHGDKIDAIGGMWFVGFD